MENRQLTLMLMGLFLHQEQLRKLIADHKDQVLLNEDQAFALIALMLSGVYSDQLLEEVCGLPQALCQSIRKRFPN